MTIRNPRLRDCDRFRGDHPLRDLGQSVFFFRFHGGEDQLSKKIQAANIAVIESIRLAGEGLQQTNHALLPRQRDCHDGARAQVPASLHVHSRVVLSVIAAHDSAAAQACSRKSRVRIKTRSRVRGDRSRRSPADDGISFRESDGYSVRTCDRQSPFGYELQHFVQHELL